MRVLPCESAESRKQASMQGPFLIAQTTVAPLSLVENRSVAAAVVQFVSISARL